MNEECPSHLKPEEFAKLRNIRFITKSDFDEFYGDYALSLSSFYRNFKEGGRVILPTFMFNRAFSKQHTDHLVDTMAPIGAALNLTEPQKAELIAGHLIKTISSRKCYDDSKFCKYLCGKLDDLVLRSDTNMTLMGKDTPSLEQAGSRAGR